MVNIRLVPLQAHIGDMKLQLLNSHLESTAEFSKERVEQLKLAFTKMKGAPSEVTTLFGGDLNLRDKEVRKVLLDEKRSLNTLEKFLASHQLNFLFFPLQKYIQVKDDIFCN